MPPRPGMKNYKYVTVTENVEINILQCNLTLVYIIVNQFCIRITVLPCQQQQQLHQSSLQHATATPSRLCGTLARHAAHRLAMPVYHAVRLHWLMHLIHCTADDSSAEYGILYAILLLSYIIIQVLISLYSPPHAN